MLLTIGILISAAFFYQSLQKRLFAERQLHLTELTIKISEVLDTTVDNVQSKAVSAKRITSQMQSVEKEKLPDVMLNVQNAIDLENGILLALDDRGRYYASNGAVGRWETLEDLVRSGNSPLIREVSFFGKKEPYMAFFQQLDTPYVIDGTADSITHIAVLILLDDMDEAFSVSLFDNQCFTYLINENGRRLYKQTFQQSFIEDYNVLSALRQEKFCMGGTIDELEEAVKGRQMLCLEFECENKGENYFVATVPLSNSDWSILLFISTKVLAANTSTVMSYIIIYFMGITVIITFVFAYLVYAAVTNQNNKKRMEEQETANQLLAQAVDEAKSASAAKSEFLSHMSHDIRTPINGIIGMTNIALKSIEDRERIEDCLKKITGASNHLLTLINDVLDMSRIESGKTQIANNPLDLNLLLENCSNIISGQLLDRSIDFVLDWGEFKHRYLMGDELHLQQVFINILGNAVKFTKDGGKIIFRAHELSDIDNLAFYRFEFEDTGIGMSEEFQKKIFEAFSQEDGGSRTNYNGTGLGMAISKKLVDLMGGTITLRSQLGVGTCFTVEMSFEIRTDIPQEMEELLEETSLNGMCVLLVEDNELNMEIAKELLEDEGVKVVTAVNGKLALDTFAASAKGEFDAILMDIMMPVMNGYEATRAIRACTHPDAETIPIVAMTANAYVEDVAAAKAAGMNEHIAKPIDMRKLLEVLHQYKKNKGRIEHE